MTAEEEKLIIQKVMSGDKNAFEDLVLANQKNVYNLALKMTKNEEDALDVSQEAFIKAYRQLKSFRGESKFSVWLYRLTYNMCIDFIRKSSSAKIVSLDYEDTSGNLKPLEIPDLRNLPEDNAIRKETRKNIADSIKLLPQNHREILVMREVTGMSYEDISGTLGINTGTVKSRLARAREKLVEILKKKGTFPEGYRQILYSTQKEGGGAS
ncbi:MAG: RNA polymerase sigma factor [Oscillospiraceae bacterium]|nr:RNA polymerase sigma factor [Oscillospiraceae bacterium]